MWVNILSGFIAFFHSTNGTNWVQEGICNLTVSVTAYHASVVYDENGFGGTSFYYQMWYWDGNDGLITNLWHATSRDGLGWSNQHTLSQSASAPLVDGISGSFFQFQFGTGAVLYNPNPTNVSSDPYTFRYQMFYDSSAAGAVIGGSREAIALAYSSDGLLWTRYGNQPVLIPPDVTTWRWDAQFAFRACIIPKGAGGVMEMFYSAGNRNIKSVTTTDTYYAHGSGHAISDNGKQWRYDPYNSIVYFQDPRPQTYGRAYMAFALYGTFSGTVNKYLFWFGGGPTQVQGYLQTFWFTEYIPTPIN